MANDMWRRVLWAALGVGLAYAYWVAWRAPAAGTFHDDGVYMVTAKALSEGKGYRIISLPGEIPQTKYPILFPLVLSAFWKIDPAFPGNVPLLKLVPLLCGALWLFLVYRLARELGASTELARGLCLVTAACPWVIYLSSAILSETMFAAALTASLLFLLRSAQGEPAGAQRNVLLAAALAAVSFHTRSIGLAVVIAGPLYLWLRGDRRQAILFALTAGLLCAPWVLWTNMQAGQGSATDAYYSKENYQGWNILLNFGAGQKIRIALQNLLMLLLSPAMIYGWPMKGIWLLPAAIAGGWLIRCNVKNGDSAPNVVIAVYLAMVACWAWAPTRFLIPILPLVLLPAITELDRLRAARRPVVAAGVIIGLALTVAVTTGKTLRLGDAMPTLAETDTFASLTAQLDWAKEHSEPSAVLAGNLDPLYYLYTGRKAVRGFAAEPYSLIYEEGTAPIGSKETALRSLCTQHVTFWMESPNSSFLEGKYLRKIQEEAHQEAPGAVRRLYDLQGTHRIYGLRCGVPVAENGGAVRAKAPLDSDIRKSQN